MKSRWKRKINVIHYDLLHALGTKDWECTISLAYELVSLPAYRVSTLLHESVHAISPTTEKQYPQAIGWEEGLVENIVKLHQDDFAQKLGLSITQAEFNERNQDNAYPALADSFEHLRKGLNYSDKNNFYDTLLRLPATERKEWIRSEAQKLSPEDKQRFAPLFRLHAGRLDKYTRHVADTNNQKGQTYAMSQEDVIDIILSARSPEEVAHARQVLRDWMKDHPHDLKVLSGGEMLEMLAQTYGLSTQDRDATRFRGIRINCDTGEVTEL